MTADHNTSLLSKYASLGDYLSSDDGMMDPNGIHWLAESAGQQGVDINTPNPIQNLGSYGGYTYPNFSSNGSGIKPAATTPSNPDLTAPTYAQFAQQFANRPSGVVYSGGSSPSGLDPADDAILQGIYAPKKKSGGFVSPAHRDTGGFIPQDAFSSAPHLESGGMPGVSQMPPWFMRREASDMTHSSGLLNSSVPGRTDQLNKMVPAGAYVIPADVVSGLGEGNTMAGANVIQAAMSTGPHGVPLPRASGHMGPPPAPHAFREPRANGGATSQVPVVLAGGEYVIHPEDVKRIGNGDIKKGHRVLDHFVVHARKQTIKQMKKLPGPMK